ncbi:exonuclease SbcCD subunit D [Rhizobium ruizarguesonis]|uniref:exonuclease SbcCD subunit D n=1 Tax=Rhizobium ruizarguesonis TaxID=2081791 RepID=UPI00103010A2|nr:exonuclease SbcCD subunit D [Rhizobium ruizarguesonis]TBD19406.1 exonuclease SbcCD subunit D [Rhizobium ruizarguesonis]TBD35034.1 exonuclease SbcCD subunit D [Rhizobium ruizarguesonis]TBD56136.1 exonuclease SbcCD subunit D [Rhizobium ruizarguesonis]TBF02929.1 exonuclease SbcCD subunit D [Rhizobium ruizarguesonis]
MRVLHTADWHIGQTLNGWSREHEHFIFLKDLCGLIVRERVDALLVAGDVFDGINPSGEAQRMLYGAIADLLRTNPRLQIVMTAGNHDPAQRLEAPEAVLNSLGVHVLGTLRRNGDDVDMGRHLIPLLDSSGATRAHVLAVPFLRQADLPGLQLGAEGGPEPAVTAAVRTLHLAMTDAATTLAKGLPVLAMGHLTCAGGLESEGAERRILIGGEHAVPPDIFPPELAYVALGHLHRPQSLDAGRVRYSGSPFPLSAAEIDYEHGVTLLDLSEGIVPRHITLPRPVPMYRLPALGAKTLAEVTAELAALSLNPNAQRNAQPFVYLSLLADRPASQLAVEIDAVIEGQPLRLAGLSITRSNTDTLPEIPPPTLGETTPEALFQTAFQQVHGLEPTTAHLAAFRDALSEI